MREEHFSRLQELFLDRRFLGRHAGSSCIIAGGGPSAGSLPKTALRKVPLIGVNVSMWDCAFEQVRSLMVAGIALDRRLVCDQVIPRAPFGFPVFAGNAIDDCGARMADWNAVRVHIIPSNNTEGFGDRFGEFSNGGNSGFAAIQLAVLMGFKKIGLAGFDGIGTNGTPIHYHDAYAGMEMRAGFFTRCCALLDEYWALFHALGIELVVLSECSELKRYPRMRLASFVQHATITSRDRRSVEQRVREDLGGRIDLPFVQGGSHVVHGDMGCYGGATNVAMPGRYRPVPTALLPYIA